MNKFLVVDDEFTSRLILQKFLSSHGEVRVCTNGREAVEVFSAALDRGEPFTLVCMDMMMPGMSGIEALSRIRKIEASRGIGRDAGVKALMTTGLDAHERDLQNEGNLFDATMTKPFRLSIMVDTLVSLGLS